MVNPRVLLYQEWQFWIRTLRALPDEEQQGVEGSQGAVKAQARSTPIF